MRIGILCPGQGAQQVGMGALLRREFPQARLCFDEADEALGFSLSGLCAEGPEDQLTDTRNAQPALLVHAVAVARVLADEQGLRPVIGAGHSLGEWSALVGAGVIGLADGLRAVQARGRFMAEAAGAGTGGMTALLGVEPEVVAELCRDAAAGEERVVAANFNGGGQIAVAGHVAALERLEAAAQSRRIRSTRLRVSAPFHSPLMAPAAERMRAVVAELELHDPAFPVVSNVDATPHVRGEDFRRLLVEQITQPVRWQECAALVAEACDLALEIGPGRVLAGLMRRIARGLACRSLGEPAEIRAWLSEGGEATA